MRRVIGILISILGICLGIYVGGWLMFVEPIIAVCMAFDAGCITATLIGFSVLKCLCASTVGVLIAYVGVLIGAMIA